MGLITEVGDLFGRRLMRGSYDNSKVIFLLPVKEDTDLCDSS